MWIIALLFSSALFAQDSITVISGSESNINESDQWATSTSRVLKRSDLVHYDSVESALQSTAGLQIKNFGGLGWQPLFHVRGSDQKHVLIVVDGVIINQGESYSQNINSISINDIENIKVYKNNSSLKYGRPSGAGVIEINTITKSKSSQFNWAVGSQSYYSASVKVPTKRALLSLSHEQTQNNFAYTNDNSTPDIESDDYNETRRSNAFYLYRAAADLDFDKHTWQTVYTTELKELPNRLNSETGSSIESHFLTTTYNYKSNGSTFRLNLNSKEETFLDPDSSIGLGIQDDKYKTDQLAAHFKKEYTKKSAIYTPGISYSHTSLVGDDKNQDEIYLNMEGEHYIGNKTISWSSSLSSYKLQSASEEQDYNFLSAAIGYKQPYLKTNLSKNVRYPFLSEVYGDRGLSTGNDELIPEKELHFDIGTFFKSKSISIEFTLFSIKYEDLIATIYSSQGIGKPINIESSRIEGYEFDFLTTLNSKLSYNFHFTWQNPRNTSEETAYKNKLLPGRFKESLSQGLIYKYKKFRFDFEYLKQSTMFYDSANTLKALNMNTLNIAITRSKLRLDFNNISDNKYELYNGYPNMGRNYKISYLSQF